MKKLRITVGDKTYDVTVEVLSDDAPHQPLPPPTAPPPTANNPVGPPKKAPGKRAPVEAGAVMSPLAGVIISVLVKEGEDVEAGQELFILEAMKMENRITAPAAGKVKEIHVSEGESVPESHALLILE